MTRSFRILISALGSEGDVAPMAWLGERLQARGHRVTLATSPRFAAAAEKRDLALAPIGTVEDFHTLADDPRLAGGARAARFLMERVFEVTPLYGAAVRRGRWDLAISSTLSFGASIAAEARGIPRVVVHLQPSVVRSATDMPVLAPWLGWLRRLPPWALRVGFKAMDLALRTKLGPVNAYRRSLRLAPAKDFYREVMDGGDLVVGLFPEWFAPPQPDWPRHLELFGFPDAASDGSISPELERFLAAGEPPILWTHGSANRHTDKFVEAARVASETLGARSIIVASKLEGRAPSTDPRTLQIGYAPFDTLMPRCAAVVHHGGIGTLRKALVAGRPQVIVPRGFDQFDNAARAERLGFARHVSYGRGLAERSAKALRTVMADPAYAATAAGLGQRICGEDRSDALIDRLETLAGRPNLS
jgi:rhamnosyltransferase subunit B